MRTVIRILLFLMIPVVIQAISGCERCARYGQCDSAYRNTPGKFCGRFHDYDFVQSPCCCPYNTQCKVSTFECLCHVPDTPYYDEYYAEAGGGFIFFLILVCILCCCCSKCCGSADHHETSHNVDTGFIPVAVPTSDEADYGSVNPPPTAPLLNETRSHSHHAHTTQAGTRGGGGNGFAAALGGFALGEMIGHALGSRERSRHNHHRHQGGGFSIFGDTGGGSGNRHRGHHGHHGGGFDIPGDTGGGGVFSGGHGHHRGGGFDIPGDTGGGHGHHGHHG